VRRLHRRFELIAAASGHPARAREEPFGLRDQASIPCGGVLLGERHVFALRIATGTATGLRVEHQREEPQRLGLLGQERGDEAAEPDRLLGEVSTPGLGAVWIGPTFGVGRVDGFEHRIEPRRELRALRHAKGDSGLLDLALRAHEPLRHRGGRDQKGRADRRRVEAERRLQDQRRADVRLIAGCAQAA
jgi:hypothetical protein